MGKAHWLSCFNSFLHEESKCERKVKGISIVLNEHNIVLLAVLWVVTKFIDTYPNLNNYNKSQSKTRKRLGKSLLSFYLAIKVVRN